MDAPARLLVRLPNWLGDVLLARPALAALRAGLPGTAFRVVAPAPFLALLGGELAPAEAEPWEGGGALVARLRAWRPDAALVLPPSFSSALFAWRTGARRRVGFRGDLRGALLSEAPARPARGDRHLADEYLDLAARLGATPVACGPLRPDAAAAAEARTRLGAERAHAVLAPGAIYGPAKRWAAERFAETGRALAARGLRVVVCGTAAEREVCEAVARGIGADAVSLAGATTLPVLTQLVARAAVAVCNDSGLAHLAAATGAPTVVVFGSTSSAWTAPLGPRVRIVQRPPVCAPCFQRTCRIGYRCLAAVTVADVVRAADALRGAAEAA